MMSSLIYVTQQIVYIIQKGSHLDKMDQMMFLLLCQITFIVKLFTFELKADSIDKLLAIMDEPLMNQQGDTVKKLMDSTTRGAFRLWSVFTAFGVTTSVLKVIFPLVHRLKGRRFEFPFWLGFDSHNIYIFCAVSALTFYRSSLTAFGTTTIGSFIVTILDQCKTQLRILRMNFEELPERAAALSSESGEHYEAVLQRLLVDCLQHYQKITAICTRLQDIFSVALLVQFCVSGWIFALASDDLVDTKILSIEFAFTMIFGLTILAELLLYCYYGDDVTHPSKYVSESIYNMAWLRAPRQFQRSLMVVMERARRPLMFKAGFIIPLSLETFVKILKSAYSFYAVLQQTKQVKR